MSGRVAYLTRSWPRLSQTFIANEVVAVERRGVELVLFALTRAREPLVQPQVSAVRAPVTYLDAGPAWTRPGEHLAAASRAGLRYAATAAYALRRADLSSGYSASSTRGCFADAVRVAAALRRQARVGRPVRHLHAHFAHDPALVALFVHRLTGIRYTLTAHARDLYQIPPASLAARVASAAGVVVCSAANADYLRRTVPAAALPPVHVVHHGVDLETFRPVRRGAPHPVPRLVSVGRLVEKKGFDDLLRACAAARDAGHRFGLEVYGDGPLLAPLRALRDRLGLSEQVRFRGQRSQPELVPVLQAADAFVLTPYVTADGDRDGVPNALAEAMACGLPVLSTDVGGVGELVRPGETGLLAPPRDVPAITVQLTALLRDVDLRRRLGAEARRAVETGFDLDAAAARLADLFTTREPR